MSYELQESDEIARLLKIAQKENGEEILEEDWMNALSSQDKLQNIIFPVAVEWIKNEKIESLRKLLDAFSDNTFGQFMLFDPSGRCKKFFSCVKSMILRLLQIVQR